jgi:hypothetical protein
VPSALSAWVNEMVELIPVVEIWPRAHSFDWAPLEEKHCWLALGAHSSESDVARVVAWLCTYMDVGASGSIQTLSQALTEALIQRDGWILPGGLLVRYAGFECWPSCCCGLEHWHEWYDVKPGGTSPWMGHNPGPWVECGVKTATIWADRVIKDGLRDRDDTVTLTYDEIGRALGRAAEELIAFHMRLCDWFARHAPSEAHIARHFAEEFHIPVPNSAPPA